MSGRNRLIVHDYAGHPFQVQLSRELARRGNDVLHLYAASIQTPRGALRRRDTDPPNLDIRGITVPGYSKDNFARRWVQERAYGHKLVAATAAFGPSVILSGNTPLGPQSRLLTYARCEGTRFVHWWQDVYSFAVASWLSERIPVLGPFWGRYFEELERRIVDKSDAVVAISSAFAELGRSWGRNAGKVKVIPNWAPLDELPVVRRDNEWAREHDLSDCFVFLYSGTLGMKHDPTMLVRLAQEFASRGDVKIVVVSQGSGAEVLRAEKERRALRNLLILPFQDFERMPEVLGTADVSVALLDENASSYSVPSKVLTYLCSARPLLLAVPYDNPAAQIVTDNEAGLAASPTQTENFIQHAYRLLQSPALRSAMAANGRRYAEKEFNIKDVADTFSDVLGCTAGDA